MGGQAGTAAAFDLDTTRMEHSPVEGRLEAAAADLVEPKSRGIARFVVVLSIVARNQAPSRAVAGLPRPRGAFLYACFASYGAGASPRLGFRCHLEEPSRYVCC